jgi:type I restriction enzyme S subunit
MFVRNALRDVIESASRLADSFCVSVVHSQSEKDQYLVGDLCKFTSGKSIAVSSLPQQPSIEASVPVYGGNGIAGFTSEPLSGITKPTVVVGRVGQFCGVTSLTSGPAWITDNALYPISIADNIDMAFLALALRGRCLNRGKLGEYLPLITQKVVHSTRIPVPDRVEQYRIVEALRDIESSASSAHMRLGDAVQYHNKIINELLSAEEDIHVVH